MRKRMGCSLRTRLLPVCLLLALIGLLAMPAEAQVLYGSIVGQIEDPSGAVVPKATVTIVNKSTGVTREAAADDSGRYSLLNVLPGTYELRVSASGFRPYARTNVEVTINTIGRVDVKLEVGALTEAVTVQSDVVALTTDKSDVHHELTSAAMTNLPLVNIYRNYQSLLNLVPGATPAAFQNAVVDTPARGLRTQINGTAPNNNNTLTDGAANIFIWLPHHVVYVQPVESIETVNVTTGSFDAEQGMAGGAAITVATKSGTNDIHGSGFWYHNNQHFNSDDVYFRGAAYRKPLTIVNQGGGTVGGPIKKDKVFYFFSFERTWERNGYSGNFSLPPDSWRTGNFATFNPQNTIIYDPRSMVNNDPRTRTPFSNNIIPRDRIHPIFDSIQKTAPSPNQPSPTDPNNLTGNYGQSGTLKLDRNQYDVKGNWNAGSKLAIWGSYSRMDAPVTGLYAFGDLGGPILGSHGFGDTNVNIPRVGFTYTFSPNFLMDGVFGYTRFDQIVGIPGGDTNVGLDVWKIPGTNGGAQYANDKRYGGLPNLVDFGFQNWGIDATWAPLFRNDRTYTYATNFSKIWSAHEVRFGYDMRRHALNHWQPETANPRGNISFSGAATILPGGTVRAANSYASALLGLVNSYSKSIQFLLMQAREWQHAFYVRDRWQASRNLTLTIGMRYEYYPLLGRNNRGIERWNPATNDVFLGGLGNVPSNAGVTVSKKLFAPRIGFAYRLGDKWVIRAGYGLTYDPLPFSRPLRGQYPATLTGTWGRGTEGAEFRETAYGWFNTLDKGIPEVPTPDINQGVLQLPLNLNMGLFSPWEGELHRGYIQSWNFTVSRKLPFDMVGDVAYVGTKTVHQLIYRNINTVGPGLGASSQNLPLAKAYGRTNAMYMWDGFGDGEYNGLQASLNKNFSKGLWLKAAYTFSKALNMADEDGWFGLPLWDWEPMMQRNYAPAGFDRTHMFTVGWIYELPVGEGKKFSLGGVADKILGGWKINGQFWKYSGTPFNVTASTNSIRCTGCNQTADLVSPVRKIDSERGPDKPYFDPASFSDPLTLFNKTGVYRPGTTGRHILHGPGYWRLHPGIFKEFRINERIRSEFRVESFNFTNTPAWNNPNSNASSPTRDANGNITSLERFMSITGASTGRQFRLGLRMQF